MTPKRILDEIDHMEQLQQRFMTDINYKIARLRNLINQEPAMPTKSKVKQLAEEQAAKRRRNYLNPQQS